MAGPPAAGRPVDRSRRNRKVGRLASRNGPGGDQHGPRDEVRRPQALGLGAVDVDEADPQGQQAPHIAQAPAQAGQATQGAAPGQLRQKPGDQILPGAEEEIAEDDQGHRQPEVPGLDQGQGRGADHAAQGGQPQQALLGGPEVRVGPQPRGGQDHQGVGHRQGQGPGQCGPGGVARHPGDEVGIEHGGDHHRRVTGVGEVVHGPGPGLDGFDAWVQGGAGHDGLLGARVGGVRARVLRAFGVPSSLWCGGFMRSPDPGVASG